MRNPKSAALKTRGRVDRWLFAPTNRQRRTRTGMLFVLPCALIMLLMMVVPLIRTVIFAFSDVKLPNFETSYAGLKNFKDVLAMPEFPDVVRNTVVWIIGTTFLRVALGFVAAFMLDGRSRLIRTLRVVALLPWTVPSIVAANSWRWMLQGDFGLINGILENIGLGALAQPWLANASTAMPTVMIAFMWSGFPFVMMMILAGIQNIPVELYESSSIDGANRFQQFLFVTLPSLKSVVVMVIVLEAINALNAFDLLFVLTGGGPGTSSEILGLMIYRLGFTLFDFSHASAASVLLIGSALICFLFYAPTQMVRRHKKARRHSS